MAQRVVTKVGNIFRTQKGSRYLQLVAIDRANLNSDVVVFFKATDADLGNDFDAIARLPVDFYIHVTASQGVKEGHWEKIGKAPVYVDLSTLVFKYYRDQFQVDMYKKGYERDRSPRLKPPFDKPFWDIWTIPDERYHSVSKEKGDRIIGEEGGIFPPWVVMKRLEEQ